MRIGYWILFGLAVSTAALAQNYSIDWHKISGGGGASTNGEYALSGTLGQAEAGATLSGGHYALTGGFWSLTAVVQSAGAPTLYISQTAGGAVTVYWQETPGWTLQQNNNLAVPANWSACGGVAASNGTNSLSVVSPAGTMFFRLRSQ